MNIDRVYKAYSGRRSGCLCGCSGKYSYTQHGAEKHNPGYDVSEWINPRSVKIIAKKVFSHPDVKIEGNIAWVDTNTRSLLVYFE